MNRLLKSFGITMIVAVITSFIWLCCYLLEHGNPYPFIAVCLAVVWSFVYQFCE